MNLVKFMTIENPLLNANYDNKQGFKDQKKYKLRQSEVIGNLTDGILSSILASGKILRISKNAVFFLRTATYPAFRKNISEELGFDLFKTDALYPEKSEIAAKFLIGKIEEKYLEYSNSKDNIRNKSLIKPLTDKSYDWTKIREKLEEHWLGRRSGQGLNPDSRLKEATRILTYAENHPRLSKNNMCRELNISSTTYNKTKNEYVLTEDDSAAVKKKQPQEPDLATDT